MVLVTDKAVMIFLANRIGCMRGCPGVRISVCLEGHGDKDVSGISMAPVLGSLGCVTVHRCRSWALRCSPSVGDVAAPGWKTEVSPT
jgi:hypothetical protein